MIVLAEIMGIVTGAKITGYMQLRYRKKLLMRSWQNMRKEEVDEKVVLYIYVVARDGKNYECLNEVASPYNMYDVEYLNDWWEGEKYIKVTGIQSISDMKIKKL